MTSQIKKVEVLALSTEDVVKHTKNMLKIDIYSDILKNWSVDGRELLKIKREDFCIHCVQNIGH